MKKIVQSLTTFKTDSKQEIKETRELTKLIWESRKRNLSEEEKIKIKGQSLDVVRVAFLSFLFVIPGSGVIIILLVKFGKRLGLRLLPSSFNKDPK